MFFEDFHLLGISLISDKHGLTFFEANNNKAYLTGDQFTSMDFLKLNAIRNRFSTLLDLCFFNAYTALIEEAPLALYFALVTMLLYF